MTTPTLPTTVQSGDIISSTLMNQVLAKLGALDNAISGLDARVTTLENAPSGTGGVLITNVTPSTVRIAERFTVEGSGFKSPAVLNDVTIDGVTVTQFLFASSPTQLVFDVPQVAQVPSSGKSSTVVVSNSNGSDSYGFTLLPELTFPQGRIEVTYTSAPVLPTATPDIEANDDYIFIFTVRTFTDRTASYQLTPTILGPTWQVEVLEDAADVPRTSNLITLPGDPTGATSLATVRVRVTIPAGEADGTLGTLRLSVTETSGGGTVTPGNAETDITVGDPPETPESRVRLTMLNVTNATLNGDRVDFTAGLTAAISYNLFSTVTTSVQITTQFRTATGWNLIQVSPNPVPVAANTNASVNVFLSGAAGAAATDLVLSLDSATTSPPVAARYSQPIRVV